MRFEIEIRETIFNSKLGINELSKLKGNRKLEVRLKINGDKIQFTIYTNKEEFSQKYDSFIDEIKQVIKKYEKNLNEHFKIGVPILYVNANVYYNDPRKTGPYNSLLNNIEKIIKKYFPNSNNRYGTNRKNGDSISYNNILNSNFVHSSVSRKW